MTLEKAEQIALAVEKANKNAKSLNQESVTESQGASGDSVRRKNPQIGKKQRFYPKLKGKQIPQGYQKPRQKY